MAKAGFKAPIADRNWNASWRYVGARGGSAKRPLLLSPPATEDPSGRRARSALNPPQAPPCRREGNKVERLSNVSLIVAIDKTQLIERAEPTSRLRAREARRECRRRGGKVTARKLERVLAGVDVVSGR